MRSLEIYGNHLNSCEVIIDRGKPCESFEVVCFVTHGQSKQKCYLEESSYKMLGDGVDLPEKYE